MRNEATPKRIASIVYQLLINTVQIAIRYHLIKLWDFFWGLSCSRFHCPVSTVIHGKQVVVNFGYTYPIYARRFSYFNAPLVELANQTWKAKGKQICFVDVGAAIGDTVLLLFANLPNAFSGFVCVDGDPEFCSYLNQNLQHLQGGRIVQNLLSDVDEEVADLIRTHTGTASAQSHMKRKASTLSSLIGPEVDLIKIDVDGFDGRVLSGAKGLIRRSHPTIIFEWHPILCQQTNNNWTEHFTTLTEEGYSRFVWFTKFGYFSHFMFGYSADEVNALADYCLADIRSDWHYDVIALHDTCTISLQELARLQFAAARQSRF